MKTKVKVTQLINSNNNPAANQFVLHEGNKIVFQSYETRIAEIENGIVTLDDSALNYSKTTSKHLFIFLCMNRKDIEKQIKTGVIKTKKLNN